MNLNLKTDVEFNTKKKEIFDKIDAIIDSSKINLTIKIKNQLEKYSDAEANYQDFLTNEWEAAAFFNDTTSTDRFLRLITGGNH